MSELLQTKIENEYQEILRTVKIAAEFGSESTQNVDMYAELVHELSDIQKKAAIVDKALAATRELPSSEEFKQAYPEAKQNAKVRSNGADKEVLKKIRNILTPETGARGSLAGDDIVMQGETSNLDPISKRPIENPTKNQKCGHIYDRATILAAIKLNPRLRCPVAGCGSREFVNSKDLI